MLDGLKNLLDSKKALVTLLVTVLLFLGVYLGKLTWDQAEKILVVLLPGYVISQGVSDAAERWQSHAAEHDAEGKKHIESAVQTAVKGVMDAMDALKKMHEPQKDEGASEVKKEPS